VATEPEAVVVVQDRQAPMRLAETEVQAEMAELTLCLAHLSFMPEAVAVARLEQAAQVALAAAEKDQKAARHMTRSTDLAAAAAGVGITAAAAAAPVVTA